MCLSFFSGKKLYLLLFLLMRPSFGGVFLKRLKDKIAIVTGVSRLKGIGAAICKELAETGYHVFFTYWTEYDKGMPWSITLDEPLKLKEELLKKGVKVSCMELDLTQHDAPE
jgi:3-oxoacyl-[acyl-carrier protein] reductase